MIMRFALSDKVSFEGKPRKTSDGYLVADVRAARVGIQIYHGDEVGKPGVDQVRVYRPPSEVFADEAMRSFTSVPVTLDHPPEDVTPDNWKEYARGYTGESIREDGGKFIRVPLILKDAKAIKSYETGEKKELSFGYYCDLKFEPGRTADGEEYDAVQTNLRGNHLAIVAAGRAGSDCRIGDHNGDRKMTLKMITQDGIPLEVTDAGAIVIATLNDRVSKANAENLKLVSDHAAALRDKDVEIKRLADEVAAEKKNVSDRDVQIADLKKQADPASIDKMVADRANVISQARTVAADGDYMGKGAAEIRRLAVARVKGSDAVKDKSDDYVQALFDACLEAAGGTKGDPIAEVMGQGGPVRTGDAQSQTDKAWTDMVSGMVDGWKTPATGSAARN